MIRFDRDLLAQSAVTVSITSQTGGETCNQIAGTIASDTPLGFYCPGSGRFDFLRSNLASGTYQGYTGNLSEAVAGNVVLTGTFVDYIDNPEGRFSSSPPPRIRASRPSELATPCASKMKQPKSGEPQ